MGTILSGILLWQASKGALQELAVQPARSSVPLRPCETQSRPEVLPIANSARQGGRGWPRGQAKMTDMEAELFPSKQKRNPLVLVGALATAGVLMGGLVSFHRGNQALSQTMMRTRVVFQGATVALMLGTSGYLSGVMKGEEPAGPDK